jgi:hypothetical protein
MERIDRADLEALAPRIDASVERDPAIDLVCSRSAWQLSFHDAFAPERPLWFAARDDACVLLAEHPGLEGPSYLEPLENSWSFAAALLGSQAPSLLAEGLKETSVPVLLLGLPMDRSRLAPLARILGESWGARTLEPTTRFVASLEGGLDGWLGRRSRSFRRNLRALERRVSDTDIEFERIPAPALEALDALYAVVLDVEARTWKAADGGGAGDEPMRGFYAGMWRRLAAAGQLRVLLARRADRVVGYLHGALVGRRFRGLQLSIDDAERELGLGNALQLEMLRWLCEEGATDYDLGGYSAYKSRWAEEGLRTFGLLLRPRD